MYAGEIVERAPARELLRNPMMPYTSALIRSIPSLEGPIHTRLERDPGPPSRPRSEPDRLSLRGPVPEGAQRCACAAAPPLVEAAVGGHEYRCWFPDGEGA